jgi:hypothetical protein
MVHPIVLIMTTKLDTQHLMLLLKRFVSVEATPLPYSSHKAIQPLTHGLLETQWRSLLYAAEFVDCGIHFHDL